MPAPPPPETLTLPGVPDGMALQRDRVVAALVLQRDMTLAQAAEYIGGVIGKLEGIIDQVVDEATGAL